MTSFAKSSTERMASVDYRLELEPGTRWMRSAELRLTPWRSEPIVVGLRPLSRFQMSGVGYGHPRFRHGSWVGEGVVAAETLPQPLLATSS